METKTEQLMVRIFRILNTNTDRDYQFLLGVTMQDITYQILQDFNQWLEEQGANHRVKCPHCSWYQFTDEVVGMSPCNECNSTGYTFESLRLEVE